VTLPLTPNSAPLSPPPRPAAETVDFPLSWLLENTSAPIQYRATIDVARLPIPPASPFYALPYTYRPALALTLAQLPDGTWNGAILTVPTPRADTFAGVGTVNAVRRLLEYGWDREAPPLLLARRPLFRLLAEDEDPAFLFELRPKGRPDQDAIRRGRALLREAAASALAQAGYEKDPRLRGAALRMLTRLDEFLRSPLAQKPFVRAGNQHVLAPEAAPPSIYLLTMLAYMPLFRSEHYAVMERLYQYVTQPLPRATPAAVIGQKVVPQPHLILGDPLPHRNAADADVPWALTWLELTARVHFLRRNEGWTRLFERFLSDRDRDGVWRPHKGTSVPRTTNPFVWPSFPLETGSGTEERLGEVTFRLGLIARLAGRQISLM
jgi:hypothetical protein